MSSDLTPSDSAATGDGPSAELAHGGVRDDRLARPEYSGPGALPLAAIDHTPRRSDLYPKAARRVERALDVICDEQQLDEVAT